LLPPQIYSKKYFNTPQYKKQAEKSVETEPKRRFSAHIGSHNPTRQI